jgi:hypothetical protein
MPVLDVPSPWVTFFREQNMHILIPLHSSNRPIGILAFGNRLNKKPLQKREETYLSSLASIAATAIEKCHMIEELGLVNRKLDRKIQELNTLFELGKEFGLVLDPDRLIRLLVFSMMGQVGVNRYLVCLKDDREMRIAASCSEDWSSAGAPRGAHACEDRSEDGRSDRYRCRGSASRPERAQSENDCSDAGPGPDEGPALAWGKA